MKNLIDTQNTIKGREMVKVVVECKSTEGESVVVSAIVPSVNGNYLVEKQLATCMKYTALGVFTDYRVYKVAA